MIEKGVDHYGAEFKRTSNDFHFRKLEQDNCVCSICHGTGAVLEFEYVTRNYQSPRTKKICKNLQAHGHSFWICPVCIENLVKKSNGLVYVLVNESQEEAIKALKTVERIEARRRELEKKMHSSFSLTEATEHYALTKLLREAENEDRD